MMAGGAWLLLIFGGTIYPIYTVAAFARRHWRDFDYLWRAAWITLHFPIMALLYSKESYGLLFCVVFSSFLASASLSAYAKASERNQKKPANES